MNPLTMPGGLSRAEARRDSLSRRRFLQATGAAAVATAIVQALRAGNIAKAAGGLQNTCVLLVRHGEKPGSGPDLDAQGWERAYAYVEYFKSYPINGAPVKLRYLFASTVTQESRRPVQTITPLSKAIGLPINSAYKDDDFQKLADAIRKGPQYNQTSILICWHHGKILDLAKALGVDSSKLPPAAKWPATWPEAVFGWALQVCFDAGGNVNPSWTFAKNEQLMYDDYGKDPPLGK